MNTLYTLYLDVQLNTAKDEVERAVTVAAVGCSVMVVTMVSIVK
jgi:hypothetical protein